jgi:hypothetical protein
MIEEVDKRATHLQKQLVFYVLRRIRGGNVLYA